MVKINYCPSCGCRLSRGSFICPSCNLDVEELFAKGYLLISNDDDNTIELFGGDFDDLAVDDLNNVGMDDEISENPNLSIQSGDEIVIVVPETNDDEIVIDFDELGIDVENMGEDVNIVIQVEGEDESDEDIYEEDLDEPNEWFFNDDPYGIVYYEFPEEDD